MDQVTFDDEFGKKEKGAKIECLGMTFTTENERREYFRDLLREKLKEPEFKKIEGFPIGEDKDIIALSDPPYYTACPNPWINDFIELHGQPYDSGEIYSNEPYASDVSEGKNSPIYNCHAYHTKVPPNAIIKFILHYTKPGDIVFDGFCGSGMTGIAAWLCGDKSSIKRLDYEIRDDGNIYDNDLLIGQLGQRRSILIDLSPAATFISSGYNHSPKKNKIKKIINNILNKTIKELGWVYKLPSKPSKDLHNILWSDVFVCPHCQHEIIFFETGVDENGEVLTEFPCPSCNAHLTKVMLGKSRAHEYFYHNQINETVKRAKQIPVFAEYRESRKLITRDPLNCEYFSKDIERELSRLLLPTNRYSPKYEQYMRDALSMRGIKTTSDFYHPRNLIALAGLFEEARKEDDNIGLYMCTAIAWQSSKLFRYSRTSGVRQAGRMTIASLIRERNVFDTFRSKSSYITEALPEIPSSKRNIISTQSSTNLLNIQNNSIDYIFVDPPFGGNLFYSELNGIWEGWLKVLTSENKEAVVHRDQRVDNKDIVDYTQLMIDSFKEFFRILKPGRWITVEFHNSQNSVWIALQEALSRAGFVVAMVAVLDKKQVTFKQATDDKSVKQDLVISAYKPDQYIEKQVQMKSGQEELVWDFIREHLKQLPIFLMNNGKAEIIIERQDYLLFDRMVAFHIERGVGVPISASEFYEGLHNRFIERDGMFFLPEQAAEYDRKRMNVREMIQQKLFVIDENSAIQWLKQQLLKKPLTFQEIHPLFLREIGGWSKNEKPMELRELLDENFLTYESGSLPSSIVSWMKKGSELRELIQKEISSGLSREDEGMLVTSNPILIKEAKDRYYIPDPRRAHDLEKLREKSLMKEFDVIASSKGKMKKFRMESCRMGFKKLWHEGDYQAIVDIAKKIPTNIVEEDRHLLMYVSNARNKLDEE